MPERKNIRLPRKWGQWALLVLILALVGVSAISRLAGLFYLKSLKNESATYRFDNQNRTVDGILFHIGFIRPGSPYFNPILDADYTTILVQIRNKGKSYIDFQPMDFFLELPDKHVYRPFDQGELLESLSTGLLGTVMAPASMKRLNETRKQVRMTYLPGARLFPGYDREGILTFPHIQGYPNSFRIRLTQLSIDGRPIPPLLFQARKIPGPQSKSGS
ncbi:MAG: hypothetical protein M1297_06600 [Nitrospirae bacterium]|nr:hypothetical protein [Nitrospirota bacterium]